MYHKGKVSRMSDAIVSVRMPKSLLHELKSLSEKEHFLDVSEEVRSIVRKKWDFHSNPEIYQLRKLSDDIGAEIRKKSEKKIQQEIAKELEKIKSQLKEGLGK